MPSLIQLPRNSTKCPKISGEIVVGRSQAARWISCVEILRSCLFKKIACNDFAIYPSRAAIQELRKRSPVSISTATPAPLQCIGRGCTVPRHLPPGLPYPLFPDLLPQRYMPVDERRIIPITLTSTIRRLPVCCEALTDLETPIPIARINTCRKSISTELQATLQIAELAAW